MKCISYDIPPGRSIDHNFIVEDCVLISKYFGFVISLERIIYPWVSKGSYTTIIMMHLTIGSFRSFAMAI